VEERPNLQWRLDEGSFSGYGCKKTASGNTYRGRFINFEHVPESVVMMRSDGTGVWGYMDSDGVIHDSPNKGGSSHGVRGEIFTTRH